MADISQNNVSGGVNVSAGGGINVGGDVVGHDKITNYNYQTPSQPPSLHQLRRPPEPFIGRDAELNALKNAVENKNHTIVGIFGMGGIGKTGLALAFAAYLTQHYHDAQILYEFGRVEGNNETKSIKQAMQHVVNSFRPGFAPPDDFNRLSADYRDVLAGQRVLLLMDDVTFVEGLDQLVPRDTTCLLLFTSRKHFSLRNYRIYHQNLSVLNSTQSCKLLLETANRIGDQARTIAELCGHLPLALRIAGSFLDVDTMKPKDYVQRLRIERNRLKYLDGIEASISVSYQRLSAVNQKVFRELGVFPAATSFDSKAEESICDDVASIALHALVEYSLVDGLKNSGLNREDTETANRFQLHNLVRIFAQTKLDSEGAAYCFDVQRRHAEHYEKVLRAANILYIEHDAVELSGLQLFDRERRNIEAGQNWSAEHWPKNDWAAILCSKFAEGGKDCIALRLSPEDQMRWRKDALASARRLGSWSDEAVHEGELGNIDAGQGEPVFAINHHEQQLALARQIGERVVECDALGNLGNAYFALGQFDRSIELYAQQCILARELNNRHREHVALANLAGAYISKGDYVQALNILNDQLIIAREFKDTESESIILLKLGFIYSKHKDYTTAIKYYREALELAHVIKDCRHEADARWNMSCCAFEENDLSGAIKHAKQALELFTRIDDPYAAAIQETLTVWQKQQKRLRKM